MGRDPSDTPLQKEMRETLGLVEEPHAADLTLRSKMTELLMGELGDQMISRIRDRPRDQPLVVDRVRLASVLACERHYLADRAEPFTYTKAKARGHLAGIVLRRWFFRDPRESRQSVWKPIESVHELIDEVADEDGDLAAFLSGLSAGGRADLAAAVIDIVHAFEESWPAGPLPLVVRANSSLRKSLLDGRLVLTYRVSLKLGQPRRVGSDVMAAVILFDIRPGVAVETEERFNRWYGALLELLQVGVAPVRAVTWYAETQTSFGEHIENERLVAATRRVAGGVRRILELEDGAKTAGVNPGWRCRFCNVSDSCNEGQAWLRRG